MAYRPHFRHAHSGHVRLALALRLLALRARLLRIRIGQAKHRFSKNEGEKDSGRFSQFHGRSLLCITHRAPKSFAHLDM